ncbi:MAG: hypothetical protein D6B27_02110 [Gammaproteobacteria bacterium]|nr:MAG: hypothetical protein D6B27_02110 [Gammaproteobacteria bacterium]
MDKKQLVNTLELWVDRLISEHAEKRKSCFNDYPELENYFDKITLSESYYVVVDNAPMPDMPETRGSELAQYIDMNVSAITYKDTYFIREDHSNDLGIHFHELIHVLQWHYLGAEAFIERYIEELLTFGYDNAPLEKMAYELEGRFSSGEVFSVEPLVEQMLFEG